MMGANDVRDFLGPPDVPYTSPQWNGLYAERVAELDAHRGRRRGPGGVGRHAADAERGPQRGRRPT